MDKTEESGPERERERVTTEGRHHHYRNRDQREFNTLLLGSLMGRIFWCSISKFYWCIKGIYYVALWAFIFGASRAVWAGPCNYCNFYPTQPIIGLYWQLEYGYYSIWSRLSQLICTKEDPCWGHFETCFYSYQTSSK